MKKVLINENGVYVSTLDIIPENIPPGYQVVEVDDNLFLHDKKQYTKGGWENYDPLTLADYKNIQWNKVKADRDLTINGGFEWANNSFDSDPTSRTNIQGGVSLAIISEQLNQPFDIDWTLKNNTTISLSISDMKAVGVALANHLNTQYEKGRVLRAQIENSTTKQAVELVVWDTTPITILGQMSVPSSITT
jgi:hypothetical protein